MNLDQKNLFALYFCCYALHTLGIQYLDSEEFEFAHYKTKISPVSILNLTSVKTRNVQDIDENFLVVSRKWLGT